MYNLLFLLEDNNIYTHIYTHISTCSSTGFYGAVEHGREAKTSLYTTFLVSSVQWPLSSSISIFRPFLDMTRETATYSWPWLKTGFLR